MRLLRYLIVSGSAAAMAGAIPEARTIRYRGSVVSRGQYAALGISYPIRKGASDE